MIPLFLLVGLAQAQDSSSCTARQIPDLHYETWAKSGGAMPGPNTVMSNGSWKLRELVLAEYSATYDGEGTQTGILQWAWVPGSRKEGQTTGDVMERHSRWREEVEIWSADDTDLPAPLKGSRMTLLMDCRAVTVCCIP